MTASAARPDDGVKVVVRVRPMSSAEKAQGSASAVSLDSTTVSLGPKTFAFDHVFGPTVGHDDVYAKSAAPLLDGFFAGYNATIFAYGQTGSGKTYTMGTNFDSGVAGVIPSVMADVFARAATLLDTKMTTTVLKLSYLEILNEEVFDLLAHGPPDSLRISDDPKKGVVVVGLSEHTVASLEDVKDLLVRGGKQRATASTSMNDTSSRSHAICTLTMQQHPASDTEPSKLSKFHLVDLAGSERAKKTHAEGDRFKEGVHINKALLVLGKVITCLSEKKKGKPAFAPYREAKLTRLLQDSLGGNSKTVMIACVSPADVNFDETTSTLRYAEQARCIQNAAVVNRDPAESEIVYLRHQVELLKLQLLQQRDVMAIPADVKQLYAELSSLKNQLHQLRQAKDQWKALAQDHEHDPDAVSQAVAAEMHDMENIDGVIAEKEVIMNALQSKTSTDSIEVRLQTLQAQYASQVEACAHMTPSRQKSKLAVATAAEQEVKRLQKLHAQGLLKITSLQQELASLKQIKAQLQRQLAQEAKDHMKEKRDQELKLMQLQRRDVKKDMQLKKLETTFEKQTSLLKRKNDELAKIQASKKQKTGMHTSRAIAAVVDDQKALVHDVLEVALTIQGAKAAVQTEFDQRKALALELSKLPPATESDDDADAKRVALEAALDIKNKTIRKLQQKLELVEKRQRGASKLCVPDVASCHKIIRSLFEVAVASAKQSDELKDMETQLVAAETQLVAQASAENSVAVASTLQANRERELLDEIAALRAQLETKRRKKSGMPKNSFLVDDDGGISTGPEVDEDDDDSDYTDHPRRKELKVSESAETTSCCQCQGKCATKMCACRARGGVCNLECACSAAKCSNRGHAEIESGVQDILDEILSLDADKENVVLATPRVEMVATIVKPTTQGSSSKKRSGLPVRRKGLNEPSSVVKKIPTMRRLYDGNTNFASLHSRLKNLAGTAPE
ncbi:hypothetical protein SPRG_12890 [Saprolegnia parasitica CBS 223.65]|uniref:Kinesin-like protein n=1 Tax=Saprolegnia parasitica (strain CBS 223.65) TaxID=695850 RepID=A0A067BT16_SAPPC|nr:hypothetical protein SPRG_12890 [Saprolegnia parasitica CBS 223.65]KDO21649.1 hypothetical protein SPRG_12890 [Saprolegnia parasitica CBS 223.65]|eukprot:XP_012207661.1 hypothetical protein SPRG_12890 [Saprolegnia parasitica CBS 223.65]